MVPLQQREGPSPVVGRLTVTVATSEWDLIHVRFGMSAIHPGRYRHYKGNEYTVLGVARHSETLEEVVVYRQDYGDRGLWVRPAVMFSETVVVDGKTVPRFAAIDGAAFDLG